MATLSIEAFRERFPEFERATDPLVASVLSYAHDAFDEELFGNRYLEAVGLQAAHNLSMSPYGLNTRQDGQETSYRKLLDELRETIPSRFFL